MNPAAPHSGTPGAAHVKRSVPGTYSPAKPSLELAMKIAAFTGQKVPVAAMRPDLAAVFGPSDRSAA